MGLDFGAEFCFFILLELVINIYIRHDCFKIVHVLKFKFKCLTHQSEECKNNYYEVVLKIMLTGTMSPDYIGLKMG